MAEVIPFNVLISELEILIKRFLERKILTEDVIQTIKDVSVQDIDNLRQTVDQATRNVLSLLLVSAGSQL